MANEINFPSNIYSGGAVTFNSQPYANFIIQSQLRQQAKQEAIDNYYRDLGKTLTPAGMAGNDVPDFVNKVNTWRQYVTQNRNVLNNPKDKNYGNAVTQANYLYNDALQHAAISKNKVAELDKFNQLRLSHPEYQITDAGLLSAHNAGLPISNGYQPLDWSTIQYDEKPAEAKDLNAYQEYVTKGLGMDKSIDTVAVNPKTKTKEITTVSSYSPSTLNTIASRAETLYKTDRKFQDLVNKMSNDPSKYDELNNKFKAIYGHDLDIKHPEEFATALLMPQTQKTEVKPYAYSPFTPYDALNISEKLFDYKNKQQQQQINNTVDAQVDKQIADAASQMKGGFYQEPVSLGVDPATLKTFGAYDMKLSPDKQHVIPVYQTGTDPKTNQPIFTTGTPISIDDYKAAYGKREVGTKYFQTKGKETKENSSKKTYKGLDKNGNPIFE